MHIPYPVDALLALVQLALGALGLLVIMPTVIVAPAGERFFGRCMFDRVGVAVVFLGLTVPLLSAAHLLDGLSLSALAVAVAALAARRRGVAWRTAWRSGAARVLDLVERRGRPVLPGLRLRPLRPLVVLAIGVTALAVVLALGDAVVHPAPDVAGFAVYVQRIRALGLGHPYANGVRQVGAESVLVGVSRLVRVDSTLLVRLTPGLAQLALVLSVLWSTWRLTSRAGAAIVAGAVITAAARSPWWPITGRTSDVIAVTAAACFLAPALAAAADEGSSRWAVGASVAAASLLHPLIGALTAVLVLAGGVVARRLPSHVLAGAVGGSLIGWVPIIFGLAMGKPLDRGPFGVPAGLGSAFRRVTDLPPDVSRPHLLLLAALTVAVLAVVVPNRPPWQRLIAGALVVAVVSVQPYRLGLPSALGPGLPDIVAAVVLAVAAGALVSMVRWRFTVVVALAAIAIIATSLPLPAPVDARTAADRVVGRMRAIAEERAPFTWTVVGEPSTFAELPASGFFIGAPAFLASYDPIKWRFDPAQPNLSLPTRHVYLFVEDAAASSEVNETGGLTADRAVDDLTRTGASSGEALRRWVQAYGRTHDDLTLAWREPGLEVYHIARSEQVEDRQTERYELARERQRAKASDCHPIGDHLLLPTPRAFQDCR